MANLKTNWRIIRDTLKSGAVSIAFDGCHKIYVNLDEEQHQEMAEIGYDPLLRVDAIGADVAFETVQNWYAESCALRFVSAVRTVDGDPNDGFITLIAQFEDETEDGTDG